MDLDEGHSATTTDEIHDRIAEQHYIIVSRHPKLDIVLPRVNLGVLFGAAVSFQVHPQNSSLSVYFVPLYPLLFPHHITPKKIKVLNFGESISPNIILIWSAQIYPETQAFN